jgi:hypothetical protein
MKIMNKQSLLATVLLAAFPVMAQVSHVAMDPYENYQGRKGLEMKGSGTGQLLFSDASDTDAGTNSPLVEGMEKGEKVQATWFDLSFKFRPKDNVSATTILRFHQDWQTYFMARSRPIQFLWTSIDGKHKPMDGLALGYSFGDFREKYSPLTLWSNETEVLGEPKIFARERKELRAEEFLFDDNKRPLQGMRANGVFQFAEGGEFRLDGQMSRLKRQQYLDFDGKNGSELQDGGDFTDFEALSYSANTELLVLNALSVGFVYQNAWEDAKTYKYDSLTANDARGQMAALDVTVMAPRANVDIAHLIDNKSLVLELSAEYAMSKTKASAPITGAEVGTGADGKALFAELSAGYRLDEQSKAVAKVHYLKNDSAFYNPLAQSTDFIIERVMNIDALYGDTASFGNLFVSPLDAMYYGVIQYSPSPRSYFDKVNGYDGSTVYEVAPYQNAPYAKNAFTNSVRFRNPEAHLQASGLQGVLYAGYATTDRSGIGANISANYGEMGSIKVNYGAYKGVAKQTSSEKFNTMGVGLTVSPTKIAGMEPKSAVQVGYQTEESPEGKSALMQFGADYQVWDRFGILGGYQSLKNDVTAKNVWYGGRVLSIQHTQWLAGLEYEFSEGFYVLGAYGQSSVDVPTVGKLTQGITNVKVRANF